MLMLMLTLMVDELGLLLVLLRAAMAHKETYTDGILALDAAAAAADAADVAAVGIVMVSSSTFRNRIPHSIPHSIPHRSARRHWVEHYC